MITKVFILRFLRRHCPFLWRCWYNRQYRKYEDQFDQAMINDVLDYIEDELKK